MAIFQRKIAIFHIRGHVRTSSHGVTTPSHMCDSPHIPRERGSQRGRIVKVVAGNHYGKPLKCTFYLERNHDYEEEDRRNSRHHRRRARTLKQRTNSAA